MKTYGAGWSKDSMQELANILGDGGQIFLGNQDDGSWEEVKPEIDKVKVDQEILSLTFDEQGYPLGKVEYSSGDITSDHYWDCECDENHSNSRHVPQMEKRWIMCMSCNTEQNAHK